MCVSMCVCVVFQENNTAAHLWQIYMFERVVRKKIFSNWKDPIQFLMHASCSKWTHFIIWFTVPKMLVYIFRLKKHNCEVNLLASISKTRKFSRMKSFNFRSYELFMPIKIPFCTMLLCYSWLYTCFFFFAQDILMVSNRWND